MKLFNRGDFNTLETPKERAEYLLGCAKGVAMIAKMKDLVPISCEATVVVLTDDGEEISLNYTAPDGGDYTEDDLIAFANDELREKVNSYL